MKGQGQFLDSLVGKLDGCGIPYMISGSLGSSFHGEPRATNDIDIVVAPTRGQLDDLVAALGDEFYASPDAAEEAFQTQGMFNVIDSAGGWKADLIIRKGRPYSREEFGRRRQVELLGVRVAVVSPEDAILSKLEWAKKGESARQFGDAVGVASVQGESLDKEYLRFWARELGVADLLGRLWVEADELS